MQKPTYGRFGGQFVPEVLMPALNELEEEYERYKEAPEFLRELNYYLTEFAGRSTPLYHARNLSKNMVQRYISNVRIWYTVVLTNLTIR